MATNPLGCLPASTRAAIAVGIGLACTTSFAYASAPAAGDATTPERSTVFQGRASAPARPAPASTLDVAQSSSGADPSLSGTPHGHEDDKQKRPSEEFWLSGIAFGGPTVYSGTFVGGPEARPHVPADFTFWPSIRFHKDVQMSIRQDISKVIASNADDDEARKRDTSLADTLITPSWVFYRNPDLGLTLSTNCTFAVPISRASRRAELYTSVRPAVSILKKGLLKYFDVRYTFRVTKNFNAYTTKVLDTETYGPIALPRSGGAENLGGGVVSDGKNLTSFGFLNWFTLTAHPTENLTVFAHYFLFNNFNYYGAPKDALASPYAAGGRGRTDETWGWIGLSYEINKVFDVGGGFVTVQAPKNGDNSGFRFPFLDIVTPSANLTQFYLNLGVSF